MEGATDRVSLKLSETRGDGTSSSASISIFLAQGRIISAIPGRDQTRACSTSSVSAHLLVQRSGIRTAILSRSSAEIPSGRVGAFFVGEATFGLTTRTGEEGSDIGVGVAGFEEPLRRNARGVDWGELSGDAGAVGRTKVLCSRVASSEYAGWNVAQQTDCWRFSSARRLIESRRFREC